MNKIKHLKTENKNFIRIIGFLVIIYSMLTPVENLFSFFGGSSFNKYLAYLIVPISILYIIKSDKLYEVKIIKMLLVILMYILMSVGWTDYGNSTISGIVTISTLILFTILVLGANLNAKEYKVLKLMNVLVMVFMAINMVMGTSLIVTGSGRISVGAGVDQNVLAISFTIPFLIILDNILRKGNSKKAINYIALMLVFYAVFLTGSRGGLLSLIGSSSMYLLLESKKSIFQKIKISLIILISIIIWIFGFMYILPETIVNRFSVDNVISSGGTGRVGIWENAFYIFNNSNFFNQVFGNGYYSAASLYKAYYGLRRGMHNDYVAILLELGIVGLVMFAFFYSNIIIEAYKRKSFLAISIMTSLILGGFGVDLIFRKFFWNAILISILDIKYNEYNTK